jgi:CRP/FNR family cyclic AMP-dependent transcriptional regulator
MKERFEGSGGANLISALLRQEFVCGSPTIAERLVAVGTLGEFAVGDELIVEGGEDNDLFLLLSGSVAIVIKGLQVNTRVAGQHVGEMAAIEPSQKRSATVVAQDTVVALRISSAELMAIGNDFPQIWLPIARILSRRLFERNDLLTPPNESPRLFIISSAEALGVAYEVATQLERVALPTVWAHGTFFAGQYTLEALENAVGRYRRKPSALSADSSRQRDFRARTLYGAFESPPSHPSSSACFQPEVALGCEWPNPRVLWHR